MPFILSAELLPEHAGGLQAVCCLSPSVLVSGGDDGAVFVWRRDGGSPPPAFSAASQVTGHVKSVRAISALPRSPSLPSGGFATGCLDGLVRVFAYDAGGEAAPALVRTLTGHTAGVTSLSLTACGTRLLSGGWEGVARVWDLASGACVAVLGGHENGTCVLGLPNGDIAVGSTGRKSEDNRHVDYKLRLWRSTASPTGPAGGFAVARVLEDHDQAVRDLALLPGGGGFVSVGNDGAVKVRDLDGTARATYVNPASAEGKPHSCFRVTAASCVGGIGGPLVITANEDESVRIIDLASGAIETIRLPGARGWWGGGAHDPELPLRCRASFTLSTDTDATPANSCLPPFSPPPPPCPPRPHFRHAVGSCDAA